MPSSNIRADGKFEYRHAFQIRRAALDFCRGALRTEIPLLPDDFFVRSAMRTRPPE
jgi:hypothetical protein